MPARISSTFRPREPTDAVDRRPAIQRHDPRNVDATVNDVDAGEDQLW